MLVWNDAHGHTPVTVVARPETFGRLDVQQSVVAFAEDCPSFWASSEFRESLAGGHIIAVDTSFFVEVLSIYCMMSCTQRINGHLAMSCAIFPRPIRH